MTFRSRSNSGNESGYASGSSTANLSETYFSRPHLKFLNQQLNKLSPQEVLKWCITSLPNLYQTSAFGLTGLAIMDMISKLDYPTTTSSSDSEPTPSQSPASIEMIFLDTLYHFPQTLDLVSRVQQRYPHIKIHTFRPLDCDNTAAFESKHGERLWETNDELYDYHAKVEPAARAYRTLGVQAVITGRRRSQGGKRGDLDIVEIDDTGLIKVNPLINWNFKEVQSYITANSVPTNDLLDQGYRSVGDWHSTVPVTDSEDERAGRWKGKNKTECGIHNKKSRYAIFLQEQEEKRQAELSEAIQQGLSIEERSQEDDDATTVAVVQETTTTTVVAPTPAAAVSV
jgi:phosphoadenosine phosphosulfate reductase